MYCPSCQYDLSRIDSRRCPECGRPFNPADPTTFDARRRGSQAILGIGLALVIGSAVILGFWAAWKPNYGYSRHAAFLTMFGIGLFAAIATAILAGRNRSWLGRVPLLLVGILSVWLGLFLGSEKGFRVWQSMPNPPDEAFADTAPMGALLLGWLPGAVIVGAVFGLSRLVFGLYRRSGRPKIPS